MVFFTLSVLDMTGGVENQVVIFSIIMKKTNKTKLTFKKMFVLIFGANSLITSSNPSTTSLGYSDPLPHKGIANWTDPSPVLYWGRRTDWENYSILH